MMDLVFEYIIIFILLFSVSLSLIGKQLDIGKKNFFLFSIVYSILIFCLSIIINHISFSINLVIEYLPYIFAIGSFLTFAVAMIYIVAWKKSKDDFCIKFKVFNKEISLFTKDRKFYNNKFIFILMILISLLFIVFSIMGLKNNNLVCSLEFAITSLLSLIIFYTLSKILLNAKREYSVLVGEYLCLKFIFLIILSMTFVTVRTLDYSMFSPYLILTADDIIIMMLLLLGFIVLVGVLLNDFYFKKLKLK